MRPSAPSCGRRQLLQRSLALTGLGLLSGCSPISLPWQSKNIPRVGLLFAGTPDADPWRAEVFRTALRELGYVEGQTLLIESRFANGESDRLSSLAAELVGLPVDVIVTDSAPSATAARDATRTLPIIMAAIGDPVGAGLVASLARPGGNITGFVLTIPGLSAKRVDLFKEALPALSRLAALWDPTSSASALSDTRAAAQSLQVNLQVLEIRRPDDLEGAFDAATSEHADGLASLGGALLFNARRRILDFAARQRLPGMFPQREYADDGGLLAYGPNGANNYWRAATYVDKILKGARPADLPVEQPTTFDFVINLKAARALGLTIPQSVLQQATEIIQ